MAVDQKIIGNNINDAGGHIGAHGDPGVSGSPLGRIDPHLNTVKNHSPHNNAEISHRALMRLRRGTTQTDNGAGKGHEKDAQSHCRNQQENQGRMQNPVGVLLFIFAPPPCH